jgi:predicted PurR-regulated permease PerM
LVRVEPWLTQQGVQVPKSADEWLAQLQTNADKLSSIPLAPVGNFLKSVIGSTFSAIGAVLAALIVPILAVYFLNDFDRMVAGVRELIPVRFRPTVVSYAREVDSVLSQFMRGQLTVMAILAVLYGGAYSALGIRLAIPIGIAAGILNIVPYVGSAFALVAGLLMAALGGGGWVKLAAVVAVYIVVQVLEGFVITPRIVGESVGLKEIWVLIALFVGGEIFGFLGVLLAVPAAAVIKIFATRAVERYRQSALFLTPAEEAAVATGPPGQLSAVVVDDPAVAEMPLATEPVPSSELAPVSGDLDEPPGEPARQDAPPEPVLPESEAPTPDDAPPSRAKKQD